MGRVYFPLEGQERLKVSNTLVTKSGIGFLDKQTVFERLVISNLIRALDCKDVTSDEQDMESSYDTILEERTSVKPNPVKIVDPKEIKEAPKQEELLQIQEPEKEESKEEVVKPTLMKREFYHVSGKRIKNPTTGNREYRVRHPDTGKLVFETSLTDEQMDLVKANAK